MKCILKTHTGDPVCFTEDTLPLPDMEDDVITGSTIYTALGSFGKIMLQEIKEQQFVIWHVLFRVQRADCFYFTIPHPALLCCITLQQHVSWKINEATLDMRQGQFRLLYSPYTEGSFSLKPGADYSLLCVEFAVDYFIQRAACFPALQPLLPKVQQGESSVAFNETPCWITLQAQDVLNRLIHFKYHDLIQPDYFNHTMDRLLHHLLQQIVQPEPAYTKYSTYDLECLFLVKQHIEKQYYDHTSISDLSHTYGINENKLKKGFMQLFGMGLFGYLELVRMRHAAEMLEETDRTIRYIAFSLGYRYESNFIKAFRNHYAATPRVYREACRKRHAAGNASRET